jgi:hypothetical protein
MNYFSKFLKGAYLVLLDLVQQQSQVRLLAPSKSRLGLAEDY